MINSPSAVLRFLSPTVSVVKLKHRTSCSCNTKATLYFSYCKSVVKDHSWTQILSFVSRNRGEFTLWGGGGLLFPSLPRIIIHLRAILVSAVWPDLNQAVLYMKILGRIRCFKTLCGNWCVCVCECVWGHSKGYLLSALFPDHDLNYALHLFVWLQTWQNMCSVFLSKLCLNTEDCVVGYHNVDQLYPSCATLLFLAWYANRSGFF